MPYIKYEDREALVGAREPETAGELNYALTLLCQTYFDNLGGRYQQINDIIGALEGCKLEFYRRLVSVYEDKKIEENGDVY